MTSRKSSLSLAKPIEMPDDFEKANHSQIDKDSHKIDIMFIPSNSAGDGDDDEQRTDDDENDNEMVSENDVQLHHANEKDEHVKTVL